jgi:hypothetical protein
MSWFGWWIAARFTVGCPREDHPGRNRSGVQWPRHRLTKQARRQQRSTAVTAQSLLMHSTWALQYTNVGDHPCCDRGTAPDQKSSWSSSSSQQAVAASTWLCICVSPVRSSKNDGSLHACALVSPLSSCCKAAPPYWNEHEGWRGDGEERPERSTLGEMGRALSTK